MAHYPQTIYENVTVHTGDSLIGTRRKTAQTQTLPYQLGVLKKTGRYDAFDLSWHPSYSDKPMVEPIPNHLFWDSDIAKWVEAAAYLEAHNPDIVGAVEDQVQKITRAQQQDGYLNIHYTVVEPGKRFTNIKDMHELYNLGHLIEAALAHRQSFGNDDLLKPILKYVDLIDQTFGPEPKIPGYPGHPEIELALLRLYEVTRDPRHLDLARFFITERGQTSGSQHFFDREAEKRGDDPTKSQPAYYPRPRSYWYAQAHKPIADQETIEGHSVRAVYLLTAVSDLLRIEKDGSQRRLHEGLLRLWGNMVGKKMTVTGGIGSEKQWEGFGPDYSLPQGTDDGAGGSYNETCASIGLMMLAERLLKLDLDSQYADVMELALYNTVLTSMSHDGKEFTYENQLASSDSHPSKREPFFVCACCPPNVCRCLGMIGGYAWDWQTDNAARTATVLSHLYIQSDVSFELAGQSIRVSQTGDWPWSGDIQYQVEQPSDIAVSLKLRIPHYAKNGFEVVPECPASELHKGYLSLPAAWIKEHPQFTLRLPLRPRFVTQHPYVQPSTIALARGPIVYCAEDVDNDWVTDHFRSIMIDLHAAKVEESQTKDGKTGDKYVGLTVRGGVSILDAGAFSSPDAPFLDVDTVDAKLAAGSKPVEQLHLVPYFFRCNRGGRGQMRVGFRQTQSASLTNGHN